jgi:hypothetical protein
VAVTNRGGDPQPEARVGRPLDPRHRAGGAEADAVRTVLATLPLGVARDYQAYTPYGGPIKPVGWWEPLPLFCPWDIHWSGGL